MSQLGFETVVARGTVLSPYRGIKGFLYQKAYPRLRGRKPHLIFIGQKV
jgi:hypothetical protein